MARRAADHGEPSWALRPIIAPEGAGAAHDTRGGGGTVCSVLTPRVSSSPCPRQRPWRVLTTWARGASRRAGRKRPREGGFYTPGNRCARSAWAARVAGG